MSTNKQLEGYRRSLYYSAFGLPEKKGNEILGKLITDERMKYVWSILDTLVKSNGEFINFWNACEKGILGWWSSQKLSKKQQKDFFMKIHKHALELSIMMNETAAFHNYSTSELIDADTIKRLFSSLTNYPDKPEYKYEDIDEDKLEGAKLYLDGATPSIHAVLDDIASKAIQFSTEHPLVPYPKSENAAIHHFIRSLSQYLKREYKKPLHDVVAVTTVVIFDKQDIDADHVKKLVNRQRD